MLREWRWWSVWAVCLSGGVAIQLLPGANPYEWVLVGATAVLGPASLILMRLGLWH